MSKKADTTILTVHYRGYGQKFINQISCSYGIQIVRRPNYWKCHEYGKKKVLVASAADTLSYLV